MDCDCRAVEKHEERKDPAYYRLLKAFMRGSFEGSLNAPRLKMVDTDCVRAVAHKIMPEIASGRQLRHRGARFGLLPLRPARRLSRLHLRSLSRKGPAAQATGKSEKEAEELAETVDRDRADFIKRYFNVDWPARHCFHLMVNSAVGDEMAVRTSFSMPWRAMGSSRRNRLAPIRRGGAMLGNSTGPTSL